MTEKEAKQKLDRMKAVLEPHKHVAIVTHNNPDPDAMAAAFGLQLLFKHSFGLESTVFYGGLIGRAENRAMVSLLKLNMENMQEIDYRRYKAVALVDTQPAAGNNQLPSKIIPDIVVDHHKPVRARTKKVPFHDVRTDYGASSTIVLEYIIAAGIGLPKNIATALFYGIKTDTYDLGREFIRADIEAYKYLVDRVDRNKLWRIEKPLHRHGYFKQMYNALLGVEMYDDLLVTVIPEMEYPDLAAEVADWMYGMKGIKWVLVIGTCGGKIYLSVRTRDGKRDAGRLIRTVVGGHGLAGGHGKIAGGIIHHEPMDAVSSASEFDRLKTRFYATLKPGENVRPVRLIHTK